MRTLRARIARLAEFEEPTLVVGETGTGKELVARALHSAGARAGRAVQIIHCAGVGDEVLTSELFGHAPGSFTGAREARAGRLRAADGSTVILDEVSETSDAFQAALLRAIEYGEIQPLGRDVSETVDVRFVATSNRPLDDLASGEAMRSDLYHRLAAFVIRVPPLRERPEDIDELAVHFVADLEKRYGCGRRLSRAAIEVLGAHTYRGNVRELRQVVVRAYVEATGDVIGPETVAEALTPDDAPPTDESATPIALEAVIRQHIGRTLRLAEGNLSQAARLLDLPRSTLQHYLVKYRVEQPEAEGARRARG